MIPTYLPRHPSAQRGRGVYMYIGGRLRMARWSVLSQSSIQSNQASAPSQPLSIITHTHKSDGSRGMTRHGMARHIRSIFKTFKQTNKQLIRMLYLCLPGSTPMSPRPIWNNHSHALPCLAQHFALTVYKGGKRTGRGILEGEEEKKQGGSCCR